MGDPTDFIVIPKIKVIYFSQTPNGQVLLEGTLNITAHNLLFYNNDENTFTILYTLFEKIEKQALQDGVRCQLILKTKTFLEYKFEIPSQEEMNVIAKSIEQLSNIQELNNIEVYFPFLYHPRNELLCPIAYPWNGYSDILSRWGCPPGKFLVSDLNRKFTVCPSYPREVIVPSICSEDNLIESAKYRHGYRFPVVAYYNKKTGASLLRAGQPLVGNMQKKCDSDKKLLNACLVTKQRGRIIDTRTKSNATQWVSKGGGTEQPGMYPHWLLEYCELERPEAMMENYEKLFKICLEQGTPNRGAHWITALSSTKWYHYVMTAMQTALKIAGFLQTDSSSVLIHGTTGTDNTLLLSSLTQLILDPYTRRLEGFLELIIREWILGGYPFRARTMGLLESEKERGRAPTFLLFLDCVWQLMRQFPRSFEYKDTLLLLIHEHTHASEYGTFLGNSMKERSTHKLNDRTFSLWAYIHSIRDSFENPMFEENFACLWPCIYPINFICWQRMYLRDPVLEDEIQHYEVKVKEVYEERDRLRKEAQRLEDIFLRLKVASELMSANKDGEQKTDTGDVKMGTVTGKKGTETSQTDTTNSPDTVTNRTDKTASETGPTKIPDTTTSETGPTKIPDTTASETGPTKIPDTTASETGPTKIPDTTASETGPTKIPDITASEMGPTKTPDTTASNSDTVANSLSSSTTDNPVKQDDPTAL
ncbi:Myotubularin-related protein 9 isoform X2 [Oopsacas minuta]|uniref:Myotubularin-related protein 9 isoform X2 n=1 Tax=Oopsacas minuta TaxID=111878 RepID=A0AAV7K624_9METZ|nr:Myotubularin-related protein 9 isoform X2 [Oopsacas minuta]